ncbi:DUF5007 domain-containing protein [Sphingobacterium tabacisoli]|uniref:DUF5007 domain-containing protein n=1 Tax=Sphingobacterium tabacisoli TaxID=2044855 RepID=A0ABW5L3M7_9SPHI|nr:DUF5007 domain-containing protein [Sphingobacterium tabacisoli]
MKNKTARLLMSGLLLGTFATISSLGNTSCYKGKEGYIADSIMYTPRLVTVIPGKSQTLSPSINGNGSSKPLTISIHKIHGVSDGQDYTEEFLQQVPVSEWIAEYTKKETTIEEVLKKRKDVMRPLLEMNPVSGKITINEVRENGILPVGDFWLDIKVKNVSGELISKRAIKLTTRAYNTYTVSTPRVGGEIKAADVKVVRKGDGTALNVKVLDSDGNVVPLDSLTHVLDKSMTFDAFKNFGKSIKDGVSTYQVLFPWPEFGSQRIYMQREETIKDPVSGELKKEAKYYFDFTFNILPSGNWDMTIELKK